MRLDGVTVISSLKECPLCLGIGVRPVHPSVPNSPLVPCLHVVPNTPEYAEALGWALHFVERPAVTH
jgi:hypothetical protein